MVKVKARFVFDVVVDIKDTRGCNPIEIVEKQVTGQLNLAHHGAFDLRFENCVVTAYPESVEDYVEQPEQTKEPYVPDGDLILEFVYNYQKIYGEHPYSVELERHIRFNEPKPDAKKIIFLGNSYRHKYGFDDYISEVMTYYNLELDDDLNLVEGES